MSGILNRPVSDKGSEKAIRVRFLPSLPLIKWASWFECGGFIFLVPKKRVSKGGSLDQLNPKSRKDRNPSGNQNRITINIRSEKVARAMTNLFSSINCKGSVCARVRWYLPWRQRTNIQCRSIDMKKKTTLNDLEVISFRPIQRTSNLLGGAGGDTDRCGGVSGPVCTDPSNCWS